MKIAIASDHVGYPMKGEIAAYLREKGHEVVDFGTYSEARCDYPVYGEKAALAVLSGECEAGVLICGTGVGISLAANKLKGVRAVVCSEPYSAKLAREHNDANMVAFGARVIGIETAKMIVDCFLAAKFEGGRHAKRVEMLAKLENGERLS